MESLIARQNQGPSTPGSSLSQLTHVHRRASPPGTPSSQAGILPKWITGRIPPAVRASGLHMECYGLAAKSDGVLLLCHC